MNGDRDVLRSRTVTPKGPARWLAGVFWLLALATVALTWSTWVELVHVWRHQFGYSHGLLVAPIVVWLAWRALGLHGSDRPVPLPWMLLAVAATSFLWYFFRVASVRTLEQVTATALLWTAATTVLGWRWGRHLLFPIGYLLFAIPIWEALVPVLQPLTSAAAGTLCELVGIPTHLDGNVVHIPNGVFSISEGCAGTHYFVASITLAALYAHLEYRRWRSSLILVGLAAVLAIVCNWIRVALVIRAGFVTGMRHPWVEDHNMVGWVLFMVGLVPLSVAARRLEASPGEKVVEESSDATAHQLTRPGRMAAVFVATLVAVAWPQAVGRIAAGQGAPAASAGAVAPPRVVGWVGPLAADVDWTPTFPSADAQFRAAYEDSGVRVTLFHATYVAQADGREVISYDNRIEGHEGWILADDRAVDMRELGRWRRSLLSSREGRRRVVLYRYTIAGRATGSRLKAKLWQGLSGLAGNRSGSIIAASTICQVSCQEAETSLARFYAKLALGSHGSTQ